MRELVVTLFLAVMLLVFGFPAEAQQAGKVHRIEYLSNSDPAIASSWAERFRLALRERGYIEGENISIEYRNGEGRRGRSSELAAELVRLKVDVIVVGGGDQLVRQVMNAPRRFPSL
jgi:putative ABC transport system substrate-binding protein